MSDLTNAADADGATPAASEDFAALLEESLRGRTTLERTVAKGRVVSIENDTALIDVGLKSEGRVSLREFASPGQPAEIKVGDEVEVYVERLEDRQGEAVLSRDKAKREEAWENLQQAYDKNERVTGVIFGRVKGGFTVDLSGAVAFLPGSQVDIRPVRDITPLLGTPAAVHAAEDGPQPRQHRRVAPLGPRGDSRGRTQRAHRQPEGRPDPAGRRQEHHRLRRLRRSRRRRRPCCT